MSTMNELFEQGHPGTTPRPARGAQDTRDASYAEIRSFVGDAQREYLDCLASVCKHGYQTRSGDVIHDLTDKEAALLLGWDRTSVNGRRNELCGGSGSKLRFVKSPAVVKSEKRRCSVTGRLVTPWKISNQLDLEV